MTRVFITICFILLAGVSRAGVVYTEPLDGGLDKYCADLLLKILNYGDTEYTLKHAEGAVSQNRDIVSLEKKLIDVIWIATSKEYEKRIKPIRIPVFKGLLGHRLFVVHKSDQVLFDDIETLSDLKKVSIGQGLGWVDVDILRSNGFNVTGALNHDQLYAMLARDRFDALLRGVHEPWAEIEAFNDASIVVEKNILVQYPLPMYFFVNNENIELANLISTNFNAMVDDGSFDSFFYENPKIKYAIRKANLSSRKIYSLPNPFLPLETPFNEKKYWYDVNRVHKYDAQAQDKVVK